MDNRKFAFYNTYQFVSLIKNFQSAREEKIEEKSEETVKPLVIQTQQRKLDLDQLHSSAGIVISLDDSKVIFQFQQDEKYFQHH